MAMEFVVFVGWSGVERQLTAADDVVGCSFSCASFSGCDNMIRTVTFTKIRVTKLSFTKVTNFQKNVTKMIE